MSARSFAPVPHREAGAPVYRYRLTCGSCGVGEFLGRQNFGAETADEQVPKKFEKRGWRVGRRQDGSDDLCPACVNREQEMRRRSLRVVETMKEESMPAQSVTQPVAEAPKAEPPREMTREHRRLIFLKLEEVYLDEASGYSPGWTDARLASDLGVPRAWVSKIRDENFGADRSAELEAALAEAKTLSGEAAEIRKAMDALTARGAEVVKRAEAVERAVKRIEAALR